MKKNVPNLTYLPRVFFFVVLFLFSLIANAQEEEDSEAQDSVKTGVSLGKIILKNPSSIITKYTYDPVLNLYFYTETIGDFDINYPLFLTPEKYRVLAQKEAMKLYFKEKSDAISGKKAGSETAQKNLLPNVYVNSQFFESIFGGNTIEVIPQGSVAMDLGLRYQKNDNPALSPRNRTNITFDFDQRISLSLLGKIGTRLSISANYDTEATFDFQNLIKLEYTPTEDDILQKIEIGNVSMPLNSSLITGAQSLFGVKTELQFGRTRVTGVFSEQRSQSRTVVAQGGGTLTDFEILALDYDEDRHFFLSQFFRDQYDQALELYPYIRSQVQITRIEVWVTNRGQRTDNVRNIVAIQDLGEVDSDKTRLGILNNDPAGFFDVAGGAFPRNDANGFNPFGIQDGSSVLTPAIRDIPTVQSGFGSLSGVVNQGFDFAILENARKLEEGRDYKLNTQLGYISLRQRLSNDEVLSVAYQYTVLGEVFQVGEFANDGIGATEVDPDTPGFIVNNTLVTKLLKSNITNISDPIWDLMMKNIYSTGAFQLSPEDFRLNILYTDPSPLNYLTPIDEATFPEGLDEQILIDVLNFDRLNVYNDPQAGGDGFFDFQPGITVDTELGNIIFTKIEPFGEFIFDVLGGGDYDQEPFVPSNANQEMYVFRNLYKLTKAAALEDSDQNKYQIKGRYKSEGANGIPIGAFNVPRGSVKVTAGGRILQEGIDYTVNYTAGTVQILDPGLRDSNTPIEVSVENNAIFGQQTRRFTGVNVEHQFNENFLLGATILNLSERPLTQKANFGTEPVNNTIFGFNGNFSTEVPFLTRLVNKLPNIDTDVPSNLSVRGEFAYLLPGAPDNSDFEGVPTAYLDDFEGAQSLIDVRGPLAWFLASPPLEFVEPNETGLSTGIERGKLAWYTIDPIFYTNQSPAGISDDDVSSNQTRRIFIDEIFPQVDIPQGQTTVQSTLDLSYFPAIKGPYNTNDNFEALQPNEKWAGIMRSITSTNFEQSNVEFIQFWVLDPFVDGVGPDNGELVFNLGNISEDILKDERKQYENGLPITDNPTGTNLTIDVPWGVVPSTQSLVYAFDADPANRTLQDVGLDGLDDEEEAAIYNNGTEDPAFDNYEFYLAREGSIIERYFNFNNTQGNSPVAVSDTDRGSTTLPDVEDIDRDLTTNTVNSYFEYRIPIQPNIQRTDKFVNDIRELEVTTPNNDIVNARWIQFKIPIREFDDAIGGITDIRSISFMRMYLTGFQDDVVLRFATLDLVRGDYRFFTRTLQTDLDNPDDDDTFSDINTVNIQENEQRQPIPYVLPPGVEREELNNNNTIIRQNEQSLSFIVCDLEAEDSRGVFKNINADLRQYQKLEMFLHAEAFQENAVGDNELVAFMRLGTDYTDNFYQIEIPLEVSRPGSSTELEIWPAINNLEISLKLLSQMKAVGIADGTLSELTFYNEALDVVNEFDPRVAGELRLAIKGNPALGNIRALMVGVKNASDTNEVCGEVWFNELRLSELDNNGGWAAVGSLDANIADFANVSATGQISTIGFGTLEQTPNERSREDAIQYGVNTNVNLGQLLPKKWGVQIPFNYSISEELITPEFDPVFQDITLDDRIAAVETEAEKEKTRTQAEDYTKRRSINVIGLRKNRAPEKKPRVYDIENFTFNYSYNEVNHRDFEIEEALDQNVRTGFTYNYNFEPLEVAPFKKKDSLFTGRYWQWLKDLNINLLPTSISLNSNYNRSFNEQRFREVFTPLVESDGLLGLPTLQQRNFLFDWQYAINYNITKSLRFNFTAANNNIVNNYFDEDEDGNTIILEDFGVYDDFFNTGEASRHTQRLELNYELPLNKIPFFSFLNANYQYTGNFDWQRGGDALNEVAGEDLNTIQNANTHAINASLTMDKLYKYFGLTKRTAKDASRANTSNRIALSAAGNKEQAKKKPVKKSSKAFNTIVDILTSVKRINISYSENNGRVLPGYTESIGFIGTLRPSAGFVFGSQSDVRFEAARRGFLTTFPDFNEQFQARSNTILNITANLAPVPDLTIDLTANRQFSDVLTENFLINEDSNGELQYDLLLANTFGDFSISTLLIGTSFDASDEFSSATFDNFKSNRLVIANRLALENGIDINNPANLDEDGFPNGFGKDNQAVLLPAFLSAYTGQSTEKVQLGAFRDIPIPNWNIKYTGFMRSKWFKKRFKRFSLSHGYRASYSINSFRTNLEFNPDISPFSQVDQAGNFLNETLFTNVTLVEQFNPLVRIDFEMKNSFSFQGEIKRGRALSLSFDNNLLNDVTDKEYIIGVGYRIKDLRFNTNFGGKKTTLRGDLNLKADLSIRDNVTVIRNLDIENNQITAGQNIWSLKISAEYALNQNLTTLFFYDQTFSEFAISTAFPQTTIRSGFTLRYNFGN